MNAVVDFSQIAPDVPAELFEFLLLQPLELLDQVELELHRYPRGELKGNGFVGEGAAIAARFGDDSHCPCLGYPPFWRQGKTAQSCLFSNSIEFDGIRIVLLGTSFCN